MILRWLHFRVVAFVSVQGGTSIHLLNLKFWGQDMKIQDFTKAHMFTQKSVRWFRCMHRTIVSVPTNLSLSHSIPLQDGSCPRLLRHTRLIQGSHQMSTGNPDFMTWWKMPGEVVHFHILPSCGCSLRPTLSLELPNLMWIWKRWVWPVGYHIGSMWVPCWEESEVWLTGAGAHT